MIILLMGVAGSGKTTVGRMLAERLRWSYYEADDFHPPANKQKMGAGIPLNDEDRAPWLGAIHHAMQECATQNRPSIFTCSALKARYREVLSAGLPQLKWVFLHAPRDVLLERLQHRSGHYMKASMLDSQFAALETPTDALAIDVRHPPEEIVDLVLRRLQPVPARDLPPSRGTP